MRNKIYILNGIKLSDQSSGINSMQRCCWLCVLINLLYGWRIVLERFGNCVTVVSSCCRCAVLLLRCAKVRQHMLERSMSSSSSWLYVPFPFEVILPRSKARLAIVFGLALWLTTDVLWRHCRRKCSIMFLWYNNNNKLSILFLKVNFKNS